MKRLILALLAISMTMVFSCQHSKRAIRVDEGASTVNIAGADFKKDSWSAPK